MDSLTKFEYHVRDLGTRSVTLFPNKAQVFRDIKNVPLRPGTNEITILGLSPTVDEHSIKVEGSGSATILDIDIEPLPNRDLWFDVYPDSDDDASSEDEDDEEEEDDTESPELLAIKERMIAVEDEINMAQKAIEVSNQRAKYLDFYCNTLNSKNEINLTEVLETYKQQRLDAHRENIEAVRLNERLQPEWRRISHKFQRLNKQHVRNTSRVGKRRDKKNLKKALRLEERLKEKDRIRLEREKFWPKYCYAVRIKLEVGGVFTPMSSRRGSLSSEVEAPQSVSDTVLASSSDPMAVDEATQTCNMVLSYITTAAFWSPSYDLQLSTTNSTGALCFDAQLNNTTSETWEKCKITLSTSEAAMSGLDDPAPTLVPWHLKLVPQSENIKENAVDRSAQELGKLHTEKAKRPVIASKSRAEMFGNSADAPVANVNAAGGPIQAPLQGKAHALQDYQMQLMLLEQQNKKRQMMARQEQDNSQQGMVRHRHNRERERESVEMLTQQYAQAQQAQQAQAQAQAQAQQQAQQMMQQQQMMQRQMGTQMMQQQMQMAPQQSSNPQSVAPDDMSDVGTIGRDRERQLGFQESLVEETGFTTTYDLPGQKTLAPKSNASSHRVARVHFPSVPFRHTIVAKYKAAAFLSAKLQNNSKITLLRGPVGVSLDGSFLGRTTLPRCAAGAFVNLDLGMDPAIRVNYLPLEVNKAAKGYFAKGKVRTYERCVRVENTRTGGGGGGSTEPTRLFVLDQIPVSDDEALRIDLLQPEGLVVEGESKPTGKPGRKLKEDDEDWGRASAQLRKQGEISWLVYLKPGKVVKLPLEYQLSIPNGSDVIQA
jgi:hypothetical protein